MKVQIGLNHDELDQAKAAIERLGGKSGPAIKNAVNRAARWARRDLVKGVNETYAYKPKLKVREVTLHSARVEDLSAYVSNTSRPRTLRQFNYRETKAGVKAHVLRKGSPKLLQRTPGGHAWIAKGGRVEGLIVQREGNPRTPLRVLHGNSIAIMLKMVYEGRHGEAKEPVIRQRLHDEIGKEIQKLTERAGGST